MTNLLYKRRQSQLLRMDIEAPLYKRGYSIRAIADEVKARLDLPTLSTRTVHKDIKLLLAEWKEYRIANIDESIQLELERIDEVVREAWEAWDKSKTDYQKKRAKQKGIPGENNSSDAVITISKELQSEEVINYGDPRYLEVIHKNLAERRKLLGLYSPEKRELTGKDGSNLIPQQLSVEEAKSLINHLENEY
ncbi:MAG: hypothetical protein II260_07885 [Muribaculaceae bacterium]|nr:hypothetical protein [Muribaculaceae bacterium]